jgi:cysteine desulfuration protein SufE
MPLPPKLQEIVDDFASMSREEKIETLIAYSESLPPIPERLKDQRENMDNVPECMTPVTLLGEKGPDGGIQFYFEIPPQSPTVRGLASILASGLNGAKPEEILSVPADFFTAMNLHQWLYRRSGTHETDCREAHAKWLVDILLQDTDRFNRHIW